MGRFTASSVLLVGSGAFLLAGCASTGRYAAECSGVPGDFRTPNASAQPGIPTHGPGGTGEPVEITAKAKPPWGIGSIPPLYVFDADAAHVNGLHPLSRLLEQPVFRQAEEQAFWGELVGESFHLVPELDACSQAAMLESGISFKAPPDGLLFMQYTTPGCVQCQAVSVAISELIESNPGLPVRWIKVTVPRSIGRVVWE